MLLAACAVLAVGFTSCKKEYKCECSVSVTDQNGNEVPGMSNSASYTFKDTKSKAKDACDGKSVTSEAGGMKATYKCAIK